VEHPDIISKFFLDSNTIDKHNQSWQYDLALEKTWLTQGPYFRLATTLLGIITVNTWKLADWHKIVNPPNAREDSKMTIKKFAGVLCYQLVTNTSAFLSSPVREPRLLSEISLPAVTSASATEVSDVTTSPSGEGQNRHIPIRTLKDNNGLLHHQVCFPVTVGKNGKKSTLTRLCKLCKENEGKKHLVGYYCLTCGESNSFCCPNKYNIERDCFKEHVENIKRTSKRMRGRLRVFCWLLAPLWCIS
jgi:hypothetical protein